MQFGLKLGIGVGLSPDDGPDLGVSQTDNAPGDAAGLEFKREALLLVKSGHDIQTVCLC